MKKLFLLVALSLVVALSFAQFPGTQTSGSSKTLSRFAGGVKADSGYIVNSFPDTLTANYGFLKNISGLMIRVEDTLYVRAECLCKWNTVGYLVEWGVDSPLLVSGNTLSIDTNSIKGVATQYDLTQISGGAETINQVLGNGDTATDKVLYFVSSASSTPINTIDNGSIYIYDPLNNIHGSYNPNVAYVENQNNNTSATITQDGTFRGLSNSRIIEINPQGRGIAHIEVGSSITDTFRFPETPNGYTWMLPSQSGTVALQSSLDLKSVTDNGYITNNPLEVRGSTIEWVNPRVQINSRTPGASSNGDNFDTHDGYATGNILISSAGEGSEGFAHDSTIMTAHDIRNIGNDGTTLIKFPIANRTTQFLPISVNGNYANSSGDITISAGGVSDTTQIHTSGATVTVGDSTTWLIINPASALTSLDVTLAQGTNHKNLKISFGGTIGTPATSVVGTLTLIPYSGDAVNGTTVYYSMETDNCIILKFNQSNNTWYK